MWGWSCWRGGHDWRPFAIRRADERTLLRCRWCHALYLIPGVWFNRAEIPPELMWDEPKTRAGCAMLLVLIVILWVVMFVVALGLAWLLAH